MSSTGDISGSRSTGLASCATLLAPCNPLQVPITPRIQVAESSDANSSSSSRIPPEIWLQVFSLATRIPGAFTHTDQRAFYAFTMDTHGISVHRRHREATDTMLTASQVCKKWTPIAAEFLFKYLLVKSGDHAAEIAAALERTRAGSSCVGERTVRLELALDGVHVWTEAHTVAFERIIAACPNLMVLSTAFSTGNCPLIHNTALVRALELSGLPSTLRRLELSGNDIVFNSVFPRINKSLDALWIRPTGNTELSKIAVGPVEFSRLQSLVITADRAGIPPEDWSMPQLDTLRMVPDPPPYPTGHSVQSFLKAQGSTLRTLDVTQFPRMNMRFCPNLVECMVPMSLLETLFSTSPIPRSLRRLTFDRTCEMHAAWIEPRNIARFSLNMRSEHETGYLPPLESIRFLLPIAQQSGRSLRETDSSMIPYWAYAVQHLREGCEPLGIELEASVGADEHTANVWRPLSYEFFLDAHKG